MGDNLWDFDESPMVPVGSPMFDVASSPPPPQPEDTLAGPSSELEQAKIAIVAAQAEVAATKAQREQDVNAIKEQARELKSRAKEAIDKVNEDNAALREQIAQLSHTTNGNSTAKDASAQLAGKDAELAQLRQQLSTLVEKNAVEETARAENAEKLTQYQVHFDQLQAQVATLQGALMAKTTEVSESEGKLAHAEESHAVDITQIRMDLKGKEDAIMQLKVTVGGENTALKEEIAQLKSAQQLEQHAEDGNLLHAQEADIAQLRQDVASKDAAIESLKSEAESAACALSNENALLKGEIAALKAAQLESNAQQANLIQEKEAQVAQLREDAIEAMKSEPESAAGPLAEEIARLMETQSVEKAAQETEIAQLRQHMASKEAVIEAMKSEAESAAGALSNETTLLKEEIGALKAAQLESNAQQANLLQEKETEIAQLRQESVGKDAAVEAITAQTEGAAGALAEENTSLKEENSALKAAQSDGDAEQRNLLEAQESEIARLRVDTAGKDAAMETMKAEAEDTASLLASENTTLIKEIAALTQAQLDANAEREQVLHSHEEKIAQLQEELRTEKATVLEMEAKANEASTAVHNGLGAPNGAPSEDTTYSEKVATLEREAAVLSTRAVDAEASAAKLAEEVSSRRVRNAIATGEFETKIARLTEQLRAKDETASQQLDVPREDAEKAALEAQIIALREEVNAKEREIEDLQRTSGIVGTHATEEVPREASINAQQELVACKQQQTDLQRVRLQKDAAEAQNAVLTAQMEQMMTNGAVAAHGIDLVFALQNKERELTHFRSAVKTMHSALEDKAVGELSQAQEEAQVLRKEAHDANEIRERMALELSILKASVGRNDSVALDRVCRRLRQLFSDELGPLDNDRAMTQQRIDPLLEDVKGAADKIRLERKHLSTLVESLRSENAKLRSDLESHSEHTRESFFTSLYKCRWMGVGRRAVDGDVALASLRYCDDGL